MTAKANCILDQSMLKEHRCSLHYLRRNANKGDRFRFVGQMVKLQDIFESF